MRYLAVLVLSLTTIVRAEETVKPDETLFGWSHAAEANLLVTSGNSSVTTVGGAFESHYKGEVWNSKGRISYLQGSNAGVSQTELFTVDARGDRTIAGGLAGFLQAGFLRNPFAGFNARTVGDVGLRYRCVDTAYHTLGFEVGIGAATENRTDVGANSFASTRASADYTWKISPTADFATQLSLLENLKTTDDLRLASITSLSVAMTRILSVKVAFRLDYLNTPVAGKVATDTSTTVALVAKF